MIVSLQGVISEKSREGVVVDVQGVGYGVLVSLDDFSKLTIGETTKLYIYEHIRENIYDLYGFLEHASKDLFERLLGVNGVGPKMAMNILSIGSVDRLKQSIAGGEVKYIQTATGVGKRVAERIVIDLKDKIGLLSSFDSSDVLGNIFGVEDEAVLGLMALGYSQNDAQKALMNVDPKLPSEERIKKALQGTAK